MSIEAPATVYFPESISDIKDCMDKTDDDGILQIYSYKECNDQSTDKLKQSRGLIFCGDKFLFPSIGYTPDCVIGDGNVQKEEYISELIRNHGSYLQFFSSTEGTLLRVFYYNKWYISTHRKLDAYQSKWGNSSGSFGKTMEEALATINLTKDSLLENLDKENVYFFFVSTTSDTRMVSLAPEKPTIVHTATLVGGKTFSLSCPSPIAHPTPIAFTTVDEVLGYVKGCDYRKEQGLIAFYDNGTHFKIINSKYHLYSQARGNEPSLMFRYLQIRSQPTYITLFNEIYPEKINDFIAYENAIVKVAKSIHSSYLSRFVMKRQTVVSQEEYAVIRHCHGWHISNREQNKVNLAIVLKNLCSENMVSTLNRLVKRILRNGKLDKPKKMEEVKEAVMEEVKEVKEAVMEAVMEEVKEVKDEMEM